MKNAQNKGKQGFTLVEIMIVVAIIGLLAALAIPNLQKARRNTMQTIFINDLRILSDAAELFAMERGTYPDDSEPSQLVPFWDQYIDASVWTNTPQVGGQWDTERDWGIGFGLGIMQPDLDAVQMREVDAKIDDGSLTTGRFRELAPRRYYLVMEE